MTGRRCAVLILALLLLTTGLSAQEADTNRFRLPDRVPTTGDLQALLRSRQLQAGQQEQIRKLLESLRDLKTDTAELQRLQQELKRNPDLRQQMEQRLLAQPDLRKAVESMIRENQPSRDQIHDLLRKVTPPTIDNPHLDPRNPPIQPENPDGNPPPPPQPEVESPEANPTQPEPPPPPPDSTPDWFRKQAADWASSWTKGVRNLDNDTLRGIVEQIRKSGLAPSDLELPTWIKDATGSFSGDLKSWLPSLGGTPESIRELFGDLSLPSVGNWEVGRPDLPSAEEAGQSGAWLLGLVLLALVGWGLWQSRGFGLFGSEAIGRSGRRLGPCPVPPEKVTTRGQLVQCFEYLARKILGQPAETSHHHETARRMRQRAATTAQEQAAVELGELYELARYSPPDEALPPDALDRARAALRQLATVNAA